MTALDTLKALKKFIQTEVAEEMKLLKEHTENEYVHPNVFMMTVPHKNFVPVDFAVPFILVGLSEGADDGDENTLNIRIMCSTYTSGVYDNELKLPSEKGYLDLMNLLERIKLKLTEKAVINGQGTVTKPINYGVYTEQLTYPFNYGYLTFGVQIPINEYPMKEFL